MKMHVVTLALVRGRGTGGLQQASGSSIWGGQPRRCGEGKAEGDPCEGGRKKRRSAWMGLKGDQQRGLAQVPSVDVSVPCSCVSLW